MQREEVWDGLLGQTSTGLSPRRLLSLSSVKAKVSENNKIFQLTKVTSCMLHKCRYIHNRTHISNISILTQAMMFAETLPRTFSG